MLSLNPLKSKLLVGGLGVYHMIVSSLVGLPVPGQLGQTRYKKGQTRTKKDNSDKLATKEDKLATKKDNSDKLATN